MKPLVLSESEIVAAAPPIGDLMAAVRAVLIDYSEGLADCPPKIGIYPPRSRHIHAMPAYLPRRNAAGLKWIADYPTNRLAGLPSGPALVILNDVENGMPISIMNGDTITAICTAVVSAVALTTFASTAASIAAVIGTGVEGRSHTIYLPQAMPRLTGLRVAGRTPDRARDFCAALQPQSSVPLTPVDSIEEAVTEADIVVTVTTTTTVPLLKANWLRPGVTVEVLDNGGKEQELLTAADAIFTDSRRQFESDEVSHLYHGRRPPIAAELGEVLAGKCSGRTADDQRILVLNLGLGACDIAVAKLIYDRALENGLGTLVEL